MSKQSYDDHGRFYSAAIVSPPLVAAKTNWVLSIYKLNWNLMQHFFTPWAVFRGCLGIGLALLVSCGSSPDPVSARLTPDACFFSDDGTTSAPLWVCDSPIQGVVLTAVGSFEKTAAGVTFQRQQAAAAARVELAQIMRVRVGALVKNFIETTGVGAAETVDRVGTLVSKQITNQSLVGSRIYRSIVNPSTGSLYVLVGLDEEETRIALQNYIDNAANEAISNNNSRGSDDAAWQRLQSDLAHEELAQELGQF